MSTHIEWADAQSITPDFTARGEEGPDGEENITPTLTLSHSDGVIAILGHVEDIREALTQAIAALPDPEEDNPPRQ